jgi:hypothetical protein
MDRRYDILAVGARPDDLEAVMGGTAAKPRCSEIVKSAALRPVVSEVDQRLRRAIEQIGQAA